MEPARAVDGAAAGQRCPRRSRRQQRDRGVHRAGEGKTAAGVGDAARERTAEVAVETPSQRRMADLRPVEERERIMKRALGLHTAVDRLERQGPGTRMTAEVWEREGS